MSGNQDGFTAIALPLARPWTVRALPSAGRIAAAAFLALLAVAATAQFLALGALPATPANDLAMHTTMVEGVLDALRSGQILPRLLTAPGHVPDIPVFQYYGFMTGLIGLPGVLLGLSPFAALMAGLTVCRLFGLGGIYAAARLLGGNRWTAALAATVYALTPYLISNLYGRIDVAESIAHCELPFLALGLVVAMTRSVPAGAAILAGTVFALALTHPIFLLYGTLCLGLMMVVSASRAAFAAGAAGAAAGLLLSAFQWYPALLTDHLLSGHFLKYSPFKAADFTSVSGLYGLPLSMADRGWVSPEAPFVYHTPGWLTLPALAGLVALLVRGRDPLERRLTLVLLVPGALFLFLSFSPVDLFQYLPRTTWALQMPYRLLAFAALFSALALPLQLPRLRWPVCLLLIAMTAAQSGPLLLRPTYQTPLAVPAHTYASQDYLIRERNGLTDRDGWLVHYAKQLYPPLPSRDDKPGQTQPNTFTDAAGWLRPDNLVLPFRTDGQQSFIRIAGESSFGNGGSRLWLADPSRPERPLSEVRRLAPGGFSVIFTLPAGEGPFRLVSAPEATTAAARQSRHGIHLQAVDGLPDRSFHRGAGAARMALLLKGRTLATDGPTSLWVAAPSAPEVPLTGRITVGPGAFETMIRLPDRPGDYVLVPSRFRMPGRSFTGAIDFRRLSINLESYETVPVTAAGTLDGHLAVPATAVDREETGAYQRRLSVHRDVWGAGNGRFARPVTVELPLAYSPFFELTQEGQPLAAQPNEAGRTVVATRTLAAPIDVRFSLPVLCWLAVAAGAALFASLGFCCRLICRLPSGRPGRRAAGPADAVAASSAP